jgi:hypothetical protein
MVVDSKKPYAGKRKLNKYKEYGRLKMIDHKQ